MFFFLTIKQTSSWFLVACSILTFRVCIHASMPVQVCASPEIKHPVVVQDISPLRSPLYVSAVMSCYVTALTPCYSTVSAQVFCMCKDRLCTFFPFLFLWHAFTPFCWCVHVCLHVHGLAVQHHRAACSLCWVLTHWRAGNMPTTAPQNPNPPPPLYPLWKEWKTCLADTHTRTHIHSSSKSHGKSHKLAYNITNIYIHCWSR